MRTAVFVVGIVLLVLGLAGGGVGLSVSNSDVATYNSRCLGLFPPSGCAALASEASTFAWVALIGGLLFLVGLILTIVGAVLKPEAVETTRVVVQPVYPTVAPQMPQPYTAPPGQPPSTGNHSRPKEMFCPTCGAHYPAGIQFCGKDATPLKETA
jgi:hypothetical protein